MSDSSRNRVRIFARVGKDYEDIYNALEGEENRELKAKYLFNRGGGRIDFMGDTQIKDDVLSYVHNYIYKSKEFEEQADLNNKDLTVNELFDKLGFTENEKSLLIETDTKHDLRPDGKVWELFRSKSGSDDETKDNVREYIESILVDICTNRGVLSETKILSDVDLRYVVNAKKHLEDPEANKNERDDQLYEPIKDWVESTGIDLANGMMKIMSVEKLQREQANLGKQRLMGVDPKVEVGRFYNASLKVNNTSAKEYLKDKKSVTEVLDKIESERKYDKITTKAPRKLPASYDMYIELHTSGRAGETPEKMVDNLAKSLAALKRKSLKYDFSIKTIHKLSDYYRKYFCLDSLKSNPEYLREALRGRTSLAKYGNSIRESIYGLKTENIENYTNDLSKLLNSMSSPNKRSAEYKKLHEAIKQAAEINSEALTPKQKKSRIIEANFDILLAVEKYVDGKEKVRRSLGGQYSFDNAMDALAIVTKYSNGMTKLSKDIINKINTVRDVSAQDAKYIDPNTLTVKYGASRAEKAHEDKLSRENKVHRTGSAMHK